MDLTQILDKISLAIRYRQNCELGHQDCATLVRHLEDLKNAISTQNAELTKLKQTPPVSTKTKKQKV